MALSLDDRLLGEKVENYCSSSESDDNQSDCESEEPNATKSTRHQNSQISQPDNSVYSGHCNNTGPKGVIEDWRRYKQLETEHRREQELEKRELINKLSITCRSQLDDEKEKRSDEKFLEQLEDELGDYEDEFMKDYRQKRMEEIRKLFKNLPTFGKVVDIDESNFVDVIDKEHPNVNIIVHVYEDGVDACQAMSGCLLCLAREYPTVKFCRMKASRAKMSYNFAENGVPALLVYKGGELIGNFIRLSDEFGNDFFATDVENFLLEHGMLADNSATTAKAIRSANKASASNDDGSDFELD